MRSHHTRRTAAALATAALTLGVATPASAAPTLKLGVYDCMRYDYGSGMLMFSSTVKLKAGKRYEHAFGRKGAKLTDKTSGTYRLRGKKLTFKGGGMAKTKAEVEQGTGARKEPFFNLMVNGRTSGISCYFVRKP